MALTKLIRLLVPGMVDEDGVDFEREFVIWFLLAALL